MNIVITLNTKHIAAAAAVIGIVGLAACSQKAVSSAKFGTTLKAQKIELTDPNGNIRSEMTAAEDGFKMFCYDAKGKTVFTIVNRDQPDGKSTVSMNLLSKESNVVLTTINGGVVEIVSANGQKATIKPEAK